MIRAFLFVLLFFPFLGRAEPVPRTYLESESPPDTVPENAPYAHRFASFTRLSVLGSFGVADMQPSTSKNSYRATGSGAAALVDFGRGWFSVQTGVRLFTSPVVVQLSPLDNPEGEKSSQSMTVSYAGIPILLKYNYIERPRSAFSIHAGVMPALLLNNPGEVDLVDPPDTYETVHLNDYDTMALGGISGSAAINRWLTFVVDLTYFRSLSPIEEGGAVNEGVQLGAGVMFFL